MLTAPVVCFDVNRHSCVVIRVTEKKVFYVPMTSEGMDLLNDSHDRFSKQYKATEYPVGRAVAHYLASTAVIPITPAARRLLEPLTSPLDIEPAAVHAAARAFVNTEREKKGLPRLDHEEDLIPRSDDKEKHMATAAKKTPKAAPAKETKKTTATKAVPVKEPKKATKAAPAEGAAKPGRKPGVGALIREMLLKGKDTASILMEVSTKFPEAKTSASNISWYKSNMKKNGEL